MPFNKVILMGNLVQEPELKQTANGTPVTSFRLAIGRKMQKDTTDFIEIVAWKSTAEFVCQYFKKGSPILICGSLQVRSWTDKDGNKRYSTEVVADEASFVGSKQQGAAPTYPTTETAFEELTDDDLPF